ncbi:MAG: protein BatD [Candidatus Omnitrophica bacterium]|nr:protein BatD [Candidatus Omnitrophota bacterium]
MMKKFILCFLILMAASPVVMADAVTFEATVDSSRISMDQVLQLTLTFTGVNHDLNPISLPAVDGFSAKYLGPSTSVSIVNGVYSSSRSFIYDLFPNKAGHFQIPPITATIGGQMYTTKSIDVDVLQTSSQTQGTSTQAPSEESLKDKVLVEASVDRTDVYLNERLDLTVKLFVNDVPLRDVQYPQFDQQGFTVDDFEKPEQNSEIINGVKYEVIEFKTHLYPNRLGNLTLGPVRIQGNVLYKTGQNSPFQSNDIFGGDIFNGFFDSYAARPVVVNSQPIALRVSPLPENDRPKDFSGAIGTSFDFHASVSPSQVKAGDPITLKMQVQGSGNFKDMTMPISQAPGFKTYEPQVKNTENGKTAEEVIIPTSTAIKQVPPLHFSYFDPALKEYRTITRGPFAVRVTAPAPGQEFKAVGFTNLAKEGPAPTAGQFSFEEMFNDIYQILKQLAASIWFWAGFGIVLAAGISYFLWRRFQDRLARDPAFARRLKARAQAREVLNQAQALISAGKTKDFYALLSKALRDFLADKWGESAAALNMNEILNRLQKAKLDEDSRAQIKSLLEQSDLVCFAGANRDTAQMRTDFAQVQNLISRLEKALKGI